MGRKRTIDRDGLMLAVERVARQAGIDGITIDSVAKEAGISKSSVVYDCANKAGLMAAFTGHRMAQYRAGLDAALARQAGRPNPLLRALIEEFRTVRPDEDIAMALLVSAGMGGNTDCRAIIQTAMAEDIGRIGAQAADPQRMLMALLTLHGMAFLEYFGFHRFDDDARTALLDELMAIVDGDRGQDDGSRALHAVPRKG